MSSQHNFQPTPPVRADTAGSQTSQSSGQLSPASPTSPAEQSFFGAIKAHIRGRSRSRSRDASRKRSKSPMMSPPPRHIAPRPQQQTRSTTMTSPTHPTRPSLSSHDRTGSDPWRGRHSNEWLFGNWSATETAKGLIRRQS